jgi:glycolate oxidase iron-sulfur subunit
MVNPFPPNLDKPAEDQYISCIRCGLCLSVCPTYREYLNETASPRGRVALARKGLEQELDLSPNLFEQMYSCFACMACNEICPVGIKPSNLAISMRDLGEQLAPARWKDTLFGNLLGKPGGIERSTYFLRLYQGLGLRKAIYALGLRNLFPERLRNLEAMLPPIPAKPLRQVLPEVSKANPESKRTIGFFLGCAQSVLFAEQSAAAVRVLTHNECDVIVPKEVVCCGKPALGYGRPEIVKHMARHNISVFEQTGLEVIVTDCATCGSTLKEYGEILAHDPEWSGRAQEFSRKVRDISEFLMEIPLKKPTGSLNQTVTYHDPCHLRRGQDVWQQPRAILNAIQGLELVEMDEANWCCGSAGSQLITHYETSLKVLDRKMDNLANTAAGVVASGCPGCQMQLQVGIERRELDVRVVHPIELLDRAYKKEQDG